MNTKPIYEIRERLKNAAIAGSLSLTEDYRLERALETFAQLERVSPVFAKAGKLVRAAREPSCPDREGMILEALSLLDAILCTQAAAGGEEGEPLPLPQKITYVPIPYSALYDLKEALRESGNGHFGYVQQVHEEHPEYFKDSRVLLALADTLGAPYAELAELAASWLKEAGAFAAELAKEKYAKAGKKEKIRRLQVIEETAQGGANEFYISCLEEEENEVRAEAIYALRFWPENAERLQALIKTERGGAKRAACRALACLDLPEGWE